MALLPAAVARPDPTRAEDAFQAVWMIFVRRAGQIRDGGALRDWLRTTAIRTCLNARAAKGHAPTDADTLPDPSADQDELIRGLDEEIAELHRQVITLYCLAGVPCDEVCRRLDISRPTLFRYQAEAKQQLARRLGAGPTRRRRRPRPDDRAAGRSETSRDAVPA